MAAESLKMIRDLRQRIPTQSPHPHPHPHPQEDGAAKIQAAQRGKEAELKDVQNKTEQSGALHSELGRVEREYDAAAKIQAVQRGKTGRQEAGVQRQHSESGALLEEMDQPEQEQDAAAKIQAVQPGPLFHSSMGLAAEFEMLKNSEDRSQMLRALSHREKLRLFEALPGELQQSMLALQPRAEWSMMVDASLRALSYDS
eukprot:TRINITY_DN6756_c0_g1_i2.p1 TRINITY_DN6756_c0_g1~~TRINITY_DN6756_c0_g1_i2.p1  ORF type:complete len:200 (-),score=58.30 TRINITY_DN6756_c0_g1_i2:273-872(-)